MAAFHVGFTEDTAIRRAHQAAPMAAIAAFLAAYFATQLWFGRRLWRHFEDAIVHVRANILRLASTSELPVVAGIGDTRIASIVNGDARIVLASTMTLTLTALLTAVSLIGSIWLALRSLPTLILLVASTAMTGRFLQRYGDARPHDDGERRLGDEGRSLGHQERRLGDEERRLDDRQRRLDDQDRRLGHYARRLDDGEDPPRGGGASARRRRPTARVPGASPR